MGVVLSMAVFESQVLKTCPGVLKLAPAARLLVVCTTPPTDVLESFPGAITCVIPDRPLHAAEPIVELEALTQSQEKFEAILFLGCLERISLVDIFYFGPELQASNAAPLIIIDLFSTEHGPDITVHLPLLEHANRLAQRAGFSFQISEQPTSAPNLYVLTCHRINEPKWEIGWISEHRAREMRSLFKSVFGQEMSEAHWHWKYGEGRGAGIGIWRRDTNTLIAHYGGTTRPVFMFGKPTLALQSGDVMVSTSDRGSLTRSGPVFLSAATMLESQIGYGAPHLLGFGFPSQRAFQLPELLGLYSNALGKVLELRWPGKPFGIHRLLWRATRIDAISEKARRIIDTHWQRMLDDMSSRVVGLRDADYVRTRYLAHPDKQYSVYWVERRGPKRVSGIVVLRQTEPHRFELLDIIAAEREIPALLRYTRHLVHRLGGTELFAWLVDNIVPIFSDDAQITDLCVFVPGNAWTAAPDNAQIQGHWWLTGGDTDFH